VEDVQVFSDRLRFKLSIFILTIRTLPEQRNFRMEQPLVNKRTLYLLEGKKMQ